MSMPDLTDPVFIAKLIDFAIFAIALVVLWTKAVAPALAAAQERENKAIEDAAAYREASAADVVAATTELEQAKSNADRMVRVGTSQAERLIVDERASAQERAGRVLAHASGEMERERYRVRRELLEDTVERAFAQAKASIAKSLDPAAQGRLVERAVTELERSRA